MNFDLESFFCNFFHHVFFFLYGVYLAWIFYLLFFLCDFFFLFLYLYPFLSFFCFFCLSNQCQFCIFFLFSNHNCYLLHFQAFFLRFLDVYEIHLSLKDFLLAFQDLFLRKDFFGLTFDEELVESVSLLVSFGLHVN